MEELSDLGPNFALVLWLQRSLLGPCRATLGGGLGLMLHISWLADTRECLRALRDGFWSCC